MQYMITNQARKIFIRLNENGQPETCVKSVAHKFTDKKAKNILSNLPKSMRQFHFSVVRVPDDSDEEICEVQIENVNNINNIDSISSIKDIKHEKVTIKNENYIVPNTVTSWMDRIKQCNNLISDARHRKDELFDQLSDIDKELSNCLHIIEMTKWKSGCDGYKEYKRVKQILEKRRVIKDELSVVQSISSCNLKHLSVDHVVDNLENRSFTIRETENGISIV